MLGLREVSPDREQWILKELEEASQLHAPFFVLVATSAVIATFGLLLNSPAVIIGAMLVAPLMTPIFSLSVALIRGRSTLLKRALRFEVVKIVSPPVPDQCGPSVEREAVSIGRSSFKRQAHLANPGLEHEGEQD